jgi:hypothetical protein
MDILFPAADNPTWQLARRSATSSGLEVFHVVRALVSCSNSADFPHTRRAAHDYRCIGQSHQFFQREYLSHIRANLRDPQRAGQCVHAHQQSYCDKSQRSDDNSGEGRAEGACA